MQGAYDNILAAIGRTPIVRLNAVSKGLRSHLFAKCEYTNPAGSVKDRPALQIILDYEAEGRLKPGGTIVEATSGNTGMGLAMASAIRGYKCIFVMPDKMSEEKIAALRAFGAKVVVTPTNVDPEDPRSYYSVARRLSVETPNAVLANQYHNPSNPKAHVLSTGPEIWEQTGGELDAMVIAMGTGGTISGIGKYLKSKKPSIKMIGVDPIGSIYYDYFRTGKMTTAHSYKVEGFGEDFLPGTMDFSVLDDVVRVTDKECFDTTRRLVREEGLYCGGSSGAAVAGAIKWAEKQIEPLNVIALLPDGAARYLSKVFNDQWMLENGFLEDAHGGTVADVVGTKSRPFWTVSPSATIGEVIAKMKEHEVSQIPVLDGDRLIGVATELALLKALVSKHAREDSPVGEYVVVDFALVEPRNSAALLSELFARGKTVIVHEGQRYTGILTNIDLIDFITRRGKRGS